MRSLGSQSHVIYRSLYNRRVCVSVCKQKLGHCHRRRLSQCFIHNMQQYQRSADTATVTAFIVRTLLKHLMWLIPSTHNWYMHTHCLLKYEQTKYVCSTQGHSRITSITEEVVPFSPVDHCPKYINFVDWVWVVEVNTCETWVDTEQQ